MSIDDLRSELRRDARRARFRRILLLLAAVLIGGVIGSVTTTWLVLNPSRPNPPLTLEELNARPNVERAMQRT
jgi:hypothetical protein